MRYLKEGRIAGHPVHVMLVHFPAGLFLSAVLFDLTGLLVDSVSFHAASAYGMAAGAGIGAVAAGFGAGDLLRIPEAAVRRTALRHGMLEAGSLMIFALLAVMRLSLYPETAVPGATEWILAAAGVGVLLAGNFFGGELVFRHGVGVQEDQP